MTWEIAMGVIALAGFVITCTTAASKLSKAMGTFETAVADLKEALKEFKTGAHETHKELFGKINDHEKRIGDHENRISILEKEKEDNK